MRTSDALRKLWVPGQPNPANQTLIDIAVDTVSLRPLRGEPAANPEIERRLHVLPKISELLETEIQTADLSEWKRAGILVSNVLFGAAVGEIAAQPEQEELAEGLSSLFDTSYLNKSEFIIIDAIDRTLPELNNLQVPGPMSAEFPVFNRIAEGLIHNRPLSEYQHMSSFREGYAIGAHVYPEILGRVVLAHEKYSADSY